METCVAVFNGTSSSSFISFVEFNNYGILNYSASGNGIQLANGASWLNQPNSTMSVTSNGNNVQIGSSNPSTHFFENYGTVIVEVDVIYQFIIRVIFNNYGVHNIGTSYVVIISDSIIF